MEKIGDYDENRSLDLLKQAETKNMEEHRAEVARRMGEAATKNMLRPVESNEIDGELGGDSTSIILNQFFANKKSDGEGQHSDEIENNENDPIMDRAVEIMQDLIMENFISSGCKCLSLEQQREGFRIIYNGALERSYDGVSSRNSATDKIAEEIPDFDREMHELAYSSPEAYTAVRGLKLRENIKNRENKWMMETPYVEEHMDRLTNNMEMGRPTFIHGHLGSGKTELAITAARDFMISRAAREEALNEVAKEVAKNAGDFSSNKKMAERLGQVYREKYKILKKRSNGETDEFNPLVVSGSGDMATTDLYLDKSLKLAKYNGTDTAGHKDQYDEEFEKWKKEHQKSYEGLTDEERAEKESRDSEEFFGLYIAKHQAYGTEVEMVAKPLLQAIEEGRPIILDEVNAIPAAVLISLNDILQRRPGDACYIPGRGQVKIRDGFSITMTGNLSTNFVDYGGTNDLNPAFLSRPDVFEYSYLPQNESGKLDEQEDMSKNQLFQVMMTYLVDKKGNLELPEIDSSVDKLFRLAQFARQTQQIFAGKNIESATYASQSGDDVDVEIDTSVLSVRNMLKVLESWDRGREKDLDKALWDGFISGVTDAKEQHAFLKLAQNYGFFSERDGWRIGDISESALVEFEDIYPGKYIYDQSPLEIYTMIDTVNLIYGDRPEREFYPEFTFDDLEIEEESLDELSTEEFEALENSQEELDDAVGALEVLAEQCGCSILL